MTASEFELLVFLQVISSNSTSTTTKKTQKKQQKNHKTFSIKEKKE